MNKYIFWLLKFKLALFLVLFFSDGNILFAGDDRFQSTETQVYDPQAEGLVDRSIVAVDDMLGWENGLQNGTEKEYYAEMDKFGPDVIPLLIKRYHSIKPQPFSGAFERLIIFAIADAVARYNGSATRPLGAERRQQALEFLVSLLSPGEDYNVRTFAIIALQRCATKLGPATSPEVEGVCGVLERGDTDPQAYDIALKIIGEIGRGEATAQRVEKAVNQVVVAHPTAGIGQDETLRLARQTVRTIRERANSPAAQ